MRRLLATCPAFVQLGNSFHHHPDVIMKSHQNEIMKMILQEDNWNQVGKPNAYIQKVKLGNTRMFWHGMTKP